MGMMSHTNYILFMDLAIRKVIRNKKAIAKYIGNFVTSTCLVAFETYKCKAIILIVMYII